MAAPQRSEREIVSASITDDDVEEVLAEFGGDARRAVRALLEDIAILALDHARTVSRGYVKGQHPYLLKVPS